jgi:hypothetical protein
MAKPESRLEQLERERSDLNKRLPKHSVPMAMMLRLEELEEEIERLRRQREEA